MKSRILVAGLLAGGLLLGLAFLAGAQSSFPIRFDDSVQAGAEPLMASPSGVIAGYLRLEPQDQPPFACTTTEHGTLYVQRDNADASGAFDQVLCHCVPTGPATSDWLWAVGTAVKSCSDFVSP